ncbi:hypothetical protein GEMRC1_002292 [Eukaryota sp. GEM-RC1]
MLPEILSNLRCPITLNLLLDPVSLQCGPCFSKSFVENWLRTNKECPVCRSAVNAQSKPFITVFMLQELISIIFSPMTIDKDELQTINPPKSQFLLSQPIDQKIDICKFKNKLVTWKVPNDAFSNPVLVKRL